MISSTKTSPKRPSSKPAPARAPSRSEPPRFDWPLAYEAEKLLRERIAVFLQRNGFARRLADRMASETGTDFFEWIDHVVLSATEENALSETGFVRDQHAHTPNGQTVYEHPQAKLPRVI